MTPSEIKDHISNEVYKVNPNPRRLMRMIEDFENALKPPVDQADGVSENDAMEILVEENANLKEQIELLKIEHNDEVGRLQGKLARTEQLIGAVQDKIEEVEKVVEEKPKKKGKEKQSKPSESATTTPAETENPEV